MIFAALSSFALAEQDSLSITTYFPSPKTAYKDLEVKKKLVVGNISQSGNTKLDSIGELKNGQVYIGHSIVFSKEPTWPNNHKKGEIIYNVDHHKLQFYNGTAWINASAQ